MYRSYGLLLPETRLSLEDVEERVRATFPDAVMWRQEDTLVVMVGDWNVNFRINDGPEVLSESVWFAGRIAGLEPGSGMDTCNRRLEVWSDTQDPFLEHFDKYQRVIDLLRGIPGLIAIDPKEPALL